MTRRKLIKLGAASTIAGTSLFFLDQAKANDENRFFYLQHKTEPFSACIEAKDKNSALKKFQQLYPKDEVENFTVREFKNLSEMVVELMKEVNELRFPPDPKKVI